MKTDYSAKEAYYKARPYFVSYKNGAINALHLEMLNIIDEESFAKHMLGKDSYTRFHEGFVKQDFNREECDKIADAYEKVAMDLLRHVKEIRDAKYLVVEDVPDEIRLKYLDFPPYNL